MRDMLVDVLLGAIVLGILALLAFGAWCAWERGGHWVVWTAVATIGLAICGTVGNAIRNG